jgi:hypothetical protein
MRTIKALVALLLGTVAIALHANAAVSVTFDAADSNIGTGHYDFILSGAPASAAFGDFNSTFSLLHWASLGNTATLQETLSPSAWNLPLNATIDVAKWTLQSYTSPNNVVDGRFEVVGTANLNGTLLWQLNWPGNNTFSSSGNVTIGAVPEPATYGATAGLGLLALLCSSSWKRLASASVS